MNNKDNKLIKDLNKRNYYIDYNVPMYITDLPYSVVPSMQRGCDKDRSEIIKTLVAIAHGITNNEGAQIIISLRNVKTGKPINWSKFKAEKQRSTRQYTKKQFRAIKSASYYANKDTKSAYQKMIYYDKESHRLYDEYQAKMVHALAINYNIDVIDGGHGARAIAFYHSEKAKYIRKTRSKLFKKWTHDLIEMLNKAGIGTKIPAIPKSIYKQNYSKNKSCSVVSTTIISNHKKFTFLDVLYLLNPYRPIKQWLYKLQVAYEHHLQYKYSTKESEQDIHDESLFFVGELKTYIRKKMRQTYLHTPYIYHARINGKVEDCILTKHSKILCHITTVPGNKAFYDINERRKALSKSQKLDNNFYKPKVLIPKSLKYSQEMLSYTKKSVERKFTKGATNRSYPDGTQLVTNNRYPDKDNNRLVPLADFFDELGHMAHKELWATRVKESSSQNKIFGQFCVKVVAKEFGKQDSKQTQLHDEKYRLCNAIATPKLNKQGHITYWILNNHTIRDIIQVFKEMNKPFVKCFKLGHFQKGTPIVNLMFLKCAFIQFRKIQKSSKYTPKDAYLDMMIRAICCKNYWTGQESEKIKGFLTGRHTFIRKKQSTNSKITKPDAEHQLSHELENDYAINQHEIDTGRSDTNKPIPIKRLKIIARRKLNRDTLIPLISILSSKVLAMKSGNSIDPREYYELDHHAPVDSYVPGLYVDHLGNIDEITRKENAEKSASMPHSSKKEVSASKALEHNDPTKMNKIIDDKDPQKVKDAINYIFKVL